MVVEGVDAGTQQRNAAAVHCRGGASRRSEEAATAEGGKRRKGERRKKSGRGSGGRGGREVVRVPGSSGCWRANLDSRRSNESAISCLDLATPFQLLVGHRACRAIMDAARRVGGGWCALRWCSLRWWVEVARGSSGATASCTSVGTVDASVARMATSRRHAVVTAPTAEEHMCRPRAIAAMVAGRSMARVTHCLTWMLDLVQRRQRDRRRERALTCLLPTLLLLTSEEPLVRPPEPLERLRSGRAR